MTDTVEAVARAIEDALDDALISPLTPYGREKVARAAIAAMPSWRRMTAAELRALPHNGSFPALVFWDGHIGLPCDPWSLPTEQIADALWCPLPEPPK